MTRCCRAKLPAMAAHVLSGATLEGFGGVKRV